MKKTEKGFNLIVTIAVVLTGAGFGLLTGLIYSEERYWWVGFMAGGVCSYPLAKFYLWQLAKTFAKAHHRILTWFWGTFVAIICGAICTAVVHGIMTLIIYPDDPFASSELPGMWPIVVIVGEIIGAGAGFVVGGICSLIYILKIKGGARETT